MDFIVKRKNEKTFWLICEKKNKEPSLLQPNWWAPSTAYWSRTKNFSYDRTTADRAINLNANVCRLANALVIYVFHLHPTTCFHEIKIRYDSIYYPSKTAAKNEIAKTAHLPAFEPATSWLKTSKLVIIVCGMVTKW